MLSKCGYVCKWPAFLTEVILEQIVIGCAKEIAVKKLSNFSLQKHELSAYLSKHICRSQFNIKTAQHRSSIHSTYIGFLIEDNKIQRRLNDQYWVSAVMLTQNSTATKLRKILAVHNGCSGKCYCHDLEDISRGTSRQCMATKENERLFSVA